MFPDLVYGRAEKPYVYRALVPTLIRTVSELTPEPVRRSIGFFVSGKAIVHGLNWEREYLYEYVLAMAIAFSCFLALAFSLRRLTRVFYDYPETVADLSPLGGLLMLPLFFRYQSYIYDPATLLLFSLALLFIAGRARIPYYVTFLLATLNKETSVLLVPVFVLREARQMGRVRLLLHVGSQAFLWIALKLLIQWFFRRNGGVIFLFSTIERNLTLAVKPFPLVVFIIVAGILLLWVAHGWTRKPVFLRRGLILVLAPLMVSALFLGCVDELRDYYEAFPFLFLLCLPTLVELFPFSGAAPAGCNRRPPSSRIDA